MLAAAHRGRNTAANTALNARLMPIPANQIGDIEVLRGAIALALAADEPFQPSSS